MLPVALALLLAVPGTAVSHDEPLRSADLPGPAWRDIARAPVRGLPAQAHKAVRTHDKKLPGSLKLVGHDPLLNRGMNAALAVHETSAGRFAYVGSRTDGTHLNAGVLVVDVSKPSRPRVVHEIGVPDEAGPGESSRELRILHEPDGGALLLVLTHACSELIHRCASPSLTGTSYVRSRIGFYDISGAKAARPERVSTYLPSRSAPQQPHEFFLWSDPLRPGRTLLYMSTPSSDTGSLPQLVVTDVSGAREGRFEEVAHWRTRIGNPGADNRLHSLTVSPDGLRAYLAYLGGGFLVADVSDFAHALPAPQVRLVTAVADRVHWGDPGAHSAIKVPGQPYALVTDEVYGKLGGVLADHGCPWGWVRMIDIADEAHPRVATEYRLPVNEESTCANVPPDREHLSSYSAHNPTLTPQLALVTWHGAGFQVIDVSNAGAPAAAAAFVPEPLPWVQTEDPALSSGRDKVVMWSFPVVFDGLIYVVDVRNGLYVLRYSGPFADELKSVSFLDGNSNQGDALRFGP